MLQEMYDAGHAVRYLNRMEQCCSLVKKNRCLPDGFADPSWRHQGKMDCRKPVPVRAGRIVVELWDAEVRTMRLHFFVGVSGREHRACPQRWLLLQLLLLLLQLAKQAL